MMKIKLKRRLRKELASEIVEILEEKLEEKNVEIPAHMLDKSDDLVRFRDDFRRDLVCEIADFISLNKRVFQKRKAA